MIICDFKFERTENHNFTITPIRASMWNSFTPLIFTACKRSLGQGNIFSSICQGFCPQGGGCLVPGGLVQGGAWSLRGWKPAPEMATAAGGTHPTGMHSCSINKRDRFPLGLENLEKWEGIFIAI